MMLWTKRSAWLAGVAVLAFLWCYTPPDTPNLCGFHWLSGRPCPFCGLTRAVFQLAKGHWQTAMEYHALSPLVPILLLASWRRAAIPWAHVLTLFIGYGVGRAFLRNSAMSFFN
ncbi:MAG: DUF2752 domain-containing protein [Bryobacteraceae bacterium]